MNIRAHRLRELRMESGKSQEVVSGFICVSQPTYSVYENGGPIPSDKLMRLAEYYGVSLEYLLGMTNERQSCSSAAESIRENDLIAFYRNLTGKNKSVFDTFVETLKKIIGYK